MLKRKSCMALASLIVIANTGAALAQAEKKPAPKAALITRETQASWPAASGKQFGDLLKSLKDDKLTVRVASHGPQSVIVIYGRDGNCRLCIGSASACAFVCSFR